MNISSLLQTITLVMCTITCFMRNLNHWTYLKSLDLIVMVSTMTDTTDQVDVQNHLSISERVWYCYLVYHAREPRQNGIAER